MSGPAKENELAQKSKEMNGNLPMQRDNVDYGKKRSAKNHKFTVKDTKNGKKYWTPAIAEDITFTGFLLKEANDAKTLEKITSLPELVVSELKKLINKGSQDLNQQWSDAAELVNTAYHVSNIRRPNPDQRGAWKQYTELLAFGVNALHKSRGPKGTWRSSDIVFAEGYNPEYLLTEKIAGHRFFVKIPGAMDVEVEAKDMSEVIRELTNKIRRHGATAEVTHRSSEGAVLTIWRQDQEVEEIIIQDVS